MKNKIVIIALFITICIFCLLLVIPRFKFNNSNENKSDTIRIDSCVELLDTIYRPMIVKDTIPVLKYKTHYKTDTIVKNGDTIQIPIDRYVYQDTLSDSVSYKAILRGYRASLDSITINYPQRTIEVLKTKTITLQKVKVKHWNYGINAGVGYGLFNRKPDAFVGFTFGYSF